MYRSRKRNYQQQRLLHHQQNNFSNGVEIKPQVNASEGVPVLPVVISGNLIYAHSQGNGVVIDDPGTWWSGMINISGNAEYITAGAGDTITSTSRTPKVGVIGEQIAVGASPAYSPTTIGSILTAT